MFTSMLGAKKNCGKLPGRGIGISINSLSNQITSKCVWGSRPPH